MPRKAQPGLLDDLFEFLKVVPSWVGPIVAAVVFATARWIPPLFIPAQPDRANPFEMMLSMVGPIVPKIAPVLGVLILGVWVIAEFHKWKNRQRFNRQTGTDSLRELSWAEFELLLAEAFRRLGYHVDHTGQNGPDGGVDLRLSQGSAVTLLQAKHWRVYRVGVKPVRELQGIVSAEKAAGGIVVTSGTFTADAVSFAEKAGIRLIAGEELSRMIQAIQAGDTPKALGMVKDGPPTCPKCLAAMVLRTARTGSNAGSQFWGCSRYPQCRGIVKE